ncbi:hypothetical protein ACFXPJ_40090, partial [Streptomyces goshikiensis]
HPPLSFLFVWVLFFFVLYPRVWVCVGDVLVGVLATHTPESLLQYGLAALLDGIALRITTPPN